jgi:hypothetical protein
MMLVMEGDVETGRKIAQKALEMAVERVTNDNTIRYVRASLGFWLSAIALGAVVLGAVLLLVPKLGLNLGAELSLFVGAGMAGATGAMLSIATRLQSFRLKPCNQSDMNYWMGRIRIGIGVIAGLILFLISPSVLSDPIRHLIPHLKGQLGQEAAVVYTWEAAVVLGLIAGFAERLIPNIMRWTSRQLEPSFGTPSQAVRAEEISKQGNRRSGHQQPISNEPC